MCISPHKGLQSCGVSTVRQAAYKPSARGKALRGSTLESALLHHWSKDGYGSGSREPQTSPQWSAYSVVRIARWIWIRETIGSPPEHSPYRYAQLSIGLASE